MSKQKKPPLRGDATEQHRPLGGRGTRETVESIVIAVILAFLFRAFEAEAFVIPTGSMAPTLQGKHLDVTCPECGYRYRAGASEGRGAVYDSTCPICRYTQPAIEQTITPTGRSKEIKEPIYDGDRILVSKFAYELAAPQRWDVIVFKFPGNAKQNYIKRLIGLPGEQIRIYHGNIYVRRAGEQEYRIARKTEHSPAKLKAMLQLVDDTEFIPTELRSAGWPSRWQTWSPKADGASWNTGPSGSIFETNGEGGENWLRYRHIVPDMAVWNGLAAWRDLSRLDDFSTQQTQAIAGMIGIDDYSVTPGDIRNVLLQYDANHDEVLDAEEKHDALRDLHRGQLITDFYAYNDTNYGSPASEYNGMNWVGDLAVECDLEVTSAGGELVFNLVKSGVNYQCRIDVASGAAKLSIDGGVKTFTDGAGQPVEQPQAETAVAGPGRYHVRFANVDNQLVLWVNDQPIAFNQPTTFLPNEEAPPAWSPQDPGDLAPVGVGSNGAAVRIKRLRVLRDVYYIALWNSSSNRPTDCVPVPNAYEAAAVMRSPEEWATARLFEDRREMLLPEHAPLNDDPAKGEKQYLPLGDNSPQSSDARMWKAQWGIGPYVEQDMLLGKALFIYWPHPWHGFMPNFSQMGFIR